MLFLTKQNCDMQIRHTTESYSTFLSKLVINAKSPKFKFKFKPSLVLWCQALLAENCNSILLLSF